MNMQTNVDLQHEYTNIVKLALTFVIMVEALGLLIYTLKEGSNLCLGFDFDFFNGQCANYKINSILSNCDDLHIISIV